MMHLYHVIVALNNKGAVLLQRNLQASLFFFQTALEAALSGQLETEKGGNTLIPPLPESSDLHRYLRLNEMETFGHVSIVQQRAFVRPIVMNASLTAYSQDPFVNLAVAAVVITFNQALVFHRRGLAECAAAERDAQRRVPDDDSVTGESRVDPQATAQAESALTSLRQARDLYKKALEALVDLGISTTRSSGHSIIDLLIMAMQNNLGQVAFLFCEYQRSMCHFVQLFLYAATIFEDNSSSDQGESVARFSAQQQQQHPQSSIRPRHDPETAFILEWHIRFFRNNFLLFPFPLLFQQQNLVEPDTEDRSSSMEPDPDTTDNTEH